MPGSLFQNVQSRDKTFTVYAGEVGADIAEQFAAHGVVVRHEMMPSPGPDPFLVIEKEEEFAGTITLDALQSLLEPPIVRPGDREEVSEGYRVLFEVLDETVFTAMNRRQLLAVTREIEDRAYRVGEGTLHVSFQNLSVFDSQTDVYRTLAADTDLDIHVHGVADWSPPEIAGITYHEYEVGEPVDRYWILGFDGGPDRTQSCGLVGEQREDGYTGFWTDDAEVVTQITDILSES